MDADVTLIVLEAAAEEAAAAVAVAVAAAAGLAVATELEEAKHAGVVAAPPPNEGIGELAPGVGVLGSDPEDIPSISI